jgi:CheY-like chemotaxis protein
MARGLPGFLPPAAPKNHMPTILLAEDEAPLRNLLRRVLETRGYKVHAAADGLQALAIGQDRISELDLLVADIRMPGIDGSELARRLKEARPNLKVLLMSGYTEACDVAEPFLRKPFQPPALLARIRQLLGPCTTGL